MIDDLGELNHEGMISLKELFNENESAQDCSNIFVNDNRIEVVHSEMSNDEHESRSPHINIRKEDSKVNSKLKRNLDLDDDRNNSCSKAAEFKKDTNTSKKIHKNVKKRLWGLFILYCICVLIYIITPLTADIEESKLGEYVKSKDEGAGESKKKI